MEIIKHVISNTCASSYKLWFSQSCSSGCSVQATSQYQAPPLASVTCAFLQTSLCTGHAICWLNLVLSVLSHPGNYWRDRPFTTTIMDQFAPKILHKLSTHALFSKATHLKHCIVAFSFTVAQYAHCLTFFCFHASLTSGRSFWFPRT
jgi:hypothetical protein